MGVRDRSYSFTSKQYLMFLTSHASLHPCLGLVYHDLREALFEVGLLWHYLREYFPTAGCGCQVGFHTIRQHLPFILHFQSHPLLPSVEEVTAQDVDL